MKQTLKLLKMLLKHLQYYSLYAGLCGEAHQLYLEGEIDESNLNLLLEYIIDHRPRGKERWNY
jgi:hypothetical protein